MPVAVAVPRVLEAQQSLVSQSSDEAKDAGAPYARMIYARPTAISTRFENVTVPSSEALSLTAPRIASQALSGSSGTCRAISATSGGLCP